MAGPVHRRRPAGLADRKRSGRPVSFTPFQVAEVMALACRLPVETGAPLSRWSCPELAREVVARSIVGGAAPSRTRTYVVATPSARADPRRPGQRRLHREVEVGRVDPGGQYRALGNTGK
ncbi:helix-turn-helix domain-containing protein [Streptomyces sp. NBC_01768]|uniref:helix-turn-helix domain-containing protein n=1 Tax=Streptomyces sp. NBC_01768 TaxID=2975938 RepID=UPI002DDAD03E|nr:helix-turn-helix domain-containing protein [Streptomyces sp. NBC_01768]